MRQGITELNKNVSSVTYTWTPYNNHPTVLPRPWNFYSVIIIGRHSIAFTTNGKRQAAVDHKTSRILSYLKKKRISLGKNSCDIWNILIKYSRPFSSYNNTSPCFPINFFGNITFARLIFVALTIIIHILPKNNNETTLQ